MDYSRYAGVQVTSGTIWARQKQRYWYPVLTDFETVVCLLEDDTVATPPERLMKWGQ